MVAQRPGDVQHDPRYLNALDAVRSELAVPMTARGKLVGVIDLQRELGAARGGGGGRGCETVRAGLVAVQEIKDPAASWGKAILQQVPH